MSNKQPCPCHSGHTFSDCCEAFLNEQKKPRTAEQLMRSRYSAFVNENERYLLQTWHEEHRPQGITFDPHTKWLGLNVKRCKRGTEQDQCGWVEFVARYKIAGKAERIEEQSFFIKKDGQWCYVEAEDKNWDQLS